MKKFIAFLGFLFGMFALQAQCGLVEVPLAQRTQNSELVIEGKVISKTAYWDDAHQMIYTAHQIEVFKVLKGRNPGANIEIISEGGEVGDAFILVEPALTLAVGDIGVFNCSLLGAMPKRKDVSPAPTYQVYAGPQGVILYDIYEKNATETFKTYPSFSAVRDQIKTLTGQAAVEVKAWDENLNSTNKTAAAVSISGFTPASLRGGVKDVLTINGSGFGTTKGKVRFKNVDAGGQNQIEALASEITSWTNTQIKVQMPSRAGTGQVAVVTSSGTLATSVASVTVTFGQTNITFNNLPFGAHLANTNGQGGYTWIMNSNFKANAAASAAFQRAFNAWKCGVGTNWQISTGASAVTAAADDNVNIITFDNAANPLPAGVLGRCTSFYHGCGSGTNFTWVVSGLDIVFDEGTNLLGRSWNFATTNPTTAQFDFETVALHELGHGNQLSHNMSNTSVMFFSVTNGVAKRSITTNANDKNGSAFVTNASTAANACNPAPATGAMTKVTCQ